MGQRIEPRRVVGPDHDEHRPILPQIEEEDPKSRRPCQADDVWISADRTCRADSFREQTHGGRHFACEPVWSPDGTRIAFSMWANGQDDIYAADPDGGNLFQVTDSPEQEGQVDWGTHQP